MALLGRPMGDPRAPLRRLPAAAIEMVRPLVEQTLSQVTETRVRGGGVERGEPLTILVDGAPVTADRGETVAATLLAAGHRTLRTTLIRGEPRGIFCGMGVCYDCLVVIDGRLSRRACVTPVANGMRVDTQHGTGPAG